MSPVLHASTMDSRLRGNDAGDSVDLQRGGKGGASSPSSFPCRRKDDAGSPTSFPRMRKGDASSPSSFPRKRESSVFPLVFLALFCTGSVHAQDWVSLEKSTPEALFAEKCGMCHRATGMGTGILARRMDPELALLENRRDLQPEFIATAVRAGFGVMFPISRAELSDAQLQILVDYLANKEAAQ